MKQLKVLAICCICVLVLGACGGDNDKLNYQKACAENDYVKAHEILYKLQDKFVKEGLPILTREWGTRRISELPGYQDYADADIYIFREEVSYLLSLDNSASNSRILKLLMEHPFYGTPASSGTVIWNEGWSLYNPYWMYYYCLQRYNQKCDVILDLSILFKNESLAKSVLSSYKETMHMNLDIHEAQFDNQDKNGAAKKYEEAVRNGVFE